MFNFIYCSDYIKPVVQKIKFALIVAMRFCKILFIVRRELIVIEFDYGKKHHFNNSLLVVRYCFKNALWYDFHGIRQTTKTGIIVLDMPNIRTKPVKLTVYGFLNKKTFLIDVKPEAILQTSSFITSIIKPHNLKNLHRPISVGKLSFKPVLPKAQIYYPSTIKPFNSIQMIYSSFSQTQFI